MGCKLIQNINHSCEYNPGGITDIYLLDISDFVSYRFKDDRLYDGCFVDKINKANVDYIKLDTVSESSFTETEDNGIYKQVLTTFIGTLDYLKTSDLLLARENRYLLIFGNSQGKLYSFGSDGGTSISFGQQSGQLSEASGYSITITKNSIYPLFEVNADRFNKTFVLGTHRGIMIPTEDNKNAILI